MEYKSIATVALQLVEGASVNASRQNIAAVNAVHVMLAGIADGSLKVESVRPVKEVK